MAKLLTPKFTPKDNWTCWRGTICPGAPIASGNRSGLCLGETLPRNAAEAASCISSDLNRWVRPFMAIRGVWEPIYIHGAV